MLWYIRMLGEFVLEREGRDTRRFRYQKAASLLAYLALNPGRAHSREMLLDLLWPEEEREVAQNRLRVLLTSLRHQLEPPGVPPGSILVSHGNGLLQLNSDAVQTDVAAFETALRRGDPLAAIALYKGDLLPEFYDDWLIPERARLETMVERARDRSTAIPSQSIEDPAPLSKKETFAAFPTPLTQFFGRDTEIEEIGGLLKKSRLVTLIGPGGTGKTRLAMETATRQRDLFPDGIYFLSLEEQFDAGQILEAIRSALRLPPAVDSGEVFSSLVQRLTERQTLLILDNFEQLVASGGGTFVENLLTRVPTLRCLVTSRRALQIDGEREFPVAQLPIPSAEITASNLAELIQSPAVALFLDRAAAIRPDFTLTTNNALVIIDICRTLEGLPLALELAASRLRAASPLEIRNGLTKRFDFLARTERWAEKDRRHSSLRLALDWGWRLLGPTQQRFFTQLSVFRGGWSAEAAAYVTDTPDIQTALESLVIDSLVRVEAYGEITRFRMLETLRTFAAERLFPEDQEPLVLRHAEYFRDRTERWDLLRFHAALSPLARWLEMAVPEIDNIRAARNYFRTLPDGAESEARLVGSALFLWIHLGLIHEAESLAQQAEERYTEPTPIRGFLLYRGAWVAQRRADQETARRRATECLAIYQASDEPIGLSFGWNSLGNIEWAEGNISAARTALEKAVAFGHEAYHSEFPESGSYRDIPTANLGGVLLAQQDFAAAHELLTDLLERERNCGVRHGSGVFRNYILATEGLGRMAEATELWREFLQEAFPNDNYFGVVEALEALARFAQDANQPERAIRLRAGIQSLQRDADTVSVTSRSPFTSPALAETVQLALS